MLVDGWARKGSRVSGPSDEPLKNLDPKTLGITLEPIENIDLTFAEPKAPCHPNVERRGVPWRDRAVSRLTDPEIVRIVNRYIGVSGGYLGIPERFTYRTHSDFYASIATCRLD